MAKTNPEWMNSQDAADLLGVKLRSLYSYASRGEVQTRRGLRDEKQYLALDLQKLKARADARKGHSAVAISAMRWGEPVLDTKVSAITDEGPLYRGKLASRFVSQKAPLERVMKQLWGLRSAPTWTAWKTRVPTRSADCRDRVIQTWLSLPSEVDEQPLRIVGPIVIASAVETVACGSSCSPDMLSAVCKALNVPHAGRELVRAALIFCADHELNASTFAARIATAAGAGRRHALVAAMSTLRGSRHGGSVEVAAERYLDAQSEELWSDLLAASARDEALLGFGHPAYRHGDVRARVLLTMARKHYEPRVAALVQLAEAHEAMFGLAPTLDFGLAAVVRALALTPRAAFWLMGLARIIGWLAHIDEQATSGQPLRPRARYVGE